MRFLIAASVAVLVTSACVRPPAPVVASRPASGPVCLQPPTYATGTARLAELRTQIDCADRALARLVGERLEIARRIGAVKRTIGAPVVDSMREVAVTGRFVRLAGAEGVPEPAARTLIQTLIVAARAQQ